MYFAWINIDKFSKKILIIIGLIYLFDFLTGNIISNFVLLYPNHIINDFEFWRLILYPLSYDNSEGIILFGITFYLFSPKIEELFLRFHFPVLIILITLLQGISYTLVFWRYQYILSGTEGISIFIITLFLLVFPKENLNFGKYGSIKVWLFISGVILSWGLIKVVKTTILVDSSLVPAIYSIAYGMVIGFVVYFQLLISKKYKTDNKDIVIPQPEELSPALISSSGFKKFNEKKEIENMVYSDDFEENEQKLNEILDKITELGRNSLSPEELEFLELYSKNM